MEDVEFFINEYFIKNCSNASIKVLSVVGVFYLSKLAIFFLWEALKIFRQYGLTSIWYEKDFSKKFSGKWAVVTGASEGLGRGYALELARRKLNIILISRNIKKLESTADEITKDYNVETKCIAFDLCLLKEKTHYKALENQLSEFDISVLINNVGYLTETLQPFLEMRKYDLMVMQDLNMLTPTLMAHMLLPKFLNKGNGAVVNVSSLVSVHPTPYMGMYSSTKIYVDYLTRCLSYEYKGRGVTFQHINPGYINTQMTNNANFVGIVADPVSCADVSLRNLGRNISGHCVHHVATVLALIIPEWLWLRLMGVHNIAWALLTGRSVKYGKKE